MQERGGAIVGGAVAFLAAVWGIAVALRRWWRADDISHRLHVVHPTIDWATDEEGGTPSFLFGVLLRNTCDRPLSFSVEDFTLVFSDRDMHVQTAAPDGTALTVAARADDIWMGAGRHRVAQLPATIRADYRIHYGEHGRKMRRALTGAFDFQLPKEKPAAGELLVIPKVSPARDERLKRRRG